MSSEDALEVILAVCAELLDLLSEVSLLFFEEFRPIFLGRIANHFANNLELMRFSISLKQRHSLPQKLSNDASNGPHINCPPIFLDLQQQLRGAVPKRDDLPCERTMRFFYNS